MGRIVAIGGGEIRDGETLNIDKFIVSLSGKERPSLLFIPTASHDAEGYIETVKKVYKELGCDVKILCLTKENIEEDDIRDIILKSDIIYVGGGNTEYMMKIWEKYSVGKYLKEAYKKNIVLSGLSAGSLCWFKAGFDDSEFIEGIDRPRYKWVKGLDILPYLNNVHYEEEERKEFDEIMKKESTDAIALESNVAFVEMDGKTFYIRADKKRNAYRFLRKGKNLEKYVIKEEEYLDI